MRVLIDTNILLTYITGRDDPYLGESRQIMKLCSEKKLEGFLALHSLSTVWYVTRKYPEKLRREWITLICELLTIAGTDNDSVLKAVSKEDFKDFEDALQDCCAVSVDADYLVTVNVDDFKGQSTVPAIKPDELIRLVAGETES